MTQDQQNNMGQYAGGTYDDGTNAERMASFDRLPKLLRRFLAEEAPFDFAVGPMAAVASSYTQAYLTAQARAIIQNEATAAYGPDHPQAKDVGALKLIPRKKRKPVGRAG
jgi:ApbE superfamily uncharacterized protein (UPF0280 family)